MATAPGALPLLGHALKLRSAERLLGFMASLPAHGDLVQVRIGRWRGYVVCHPDLVHQVLVDDSVFDKGGRLFDKVREVLGNGVGTCPHREHRQQRRSLQPAFHRDRLPAYAEVMTEQIADLLSSWRDGQSIDVVTQMRTLSSRTLARTLFTAEYASEAVAAMEQSLPDLMRGIYRHLFTPSAVLQRLPTPVNRRFQRAMIRTRSAVIRAARDYRAAGQDHGDLFSTLLTARDEHGRPLTDTQICDQIVTVMMAGIDTTANALAWSLHLLTEHPGIWQRLHTEADRVLDGRAATWTDLPRLDLTTRVLTETLRLNPPVWTFTRATTTDTDSAGHPLPAGTTVIISPYVIHRRPDLYPDPERFDPDRPLSAPRHASIPFGGGAHRCIGDTYAVTLATLTLSTLASRWHLEATTRQPVSPAPHATLVPKSLHLRVRSRAHNQVSERSPQ
ncbi:cytochrome P450 [Streptomyces sp. NPDC056716]|uniref:cytochrome P450 n=1 Tax=unclassified Streptomyces TaxID=2593676 RepID=UPI00369CCB6C